MRFTNVSNAWIEAAKILAIDPSATVSCPVCEEKNLVAHDVLIEDSNKLERIMRCPNCGSQNVLLMKNKS